MTMNPEVPSAGDSVTITISRAEARLAENALRSFLSDFGHDEADIIEAVRRVLTKVETALSAPVST